MLVLGCARRLVILLRASEHRCFCQACRYQRDDICWSVSLGGERASGEAQGGRALEVKRSVLPLMNMADQEADRSTSPLVSFASPRGPSPPSMGDPLSMHVPRRSSFGITSTLREFARRDFATSRRTSFEVRRREGRYESRDLPPLSLSPTWCGLIVVQGTIRAASLAWAALISPPPGKTNGCSSRIALPTQSDRTSLADGANVLQGEIWRREASPGDAQEELSWVKVCFRPV
jgi:hypothetical protein